MEKTIKEIRISQIDSFPGHPFKVRDDDDMISLMESIAQNGLMMPIVVRKVFHKRFELISGHRRMRAFQLLGKDMIPAEITNLTKEEATIYMIDSNLQRSIILPSEKAFAYKMRLEAIKEYKWRMNAGRVPERDFEALNKYLYCSPLGNDEDKKAWQLTAEILGESKNQMYRYIRLTELISELLNLVDEGKLGMRTGVDLSYINKDNQKTIFEVIDMEEACPTHAQAIRLRKLEEQGDLTEEIIHTIMREQKPNQKERISIKVSRIKDYLPPGLSTRQYEEYVVDILKKYNTSLPAGQRPSRFPKRSMVE